MSIFNSDYKYRNESYSLEGEDMIVKRFFKEKRGGFYIDVGANHPFKYSNTYYFYKNGWKGLNIDADNDCIAKLNKFRSKDINVHAIVSNSKSKRVFYKFNESALNTFSKSLSEDYIGAGYNIVSTQKVPSVTLKSILDKKLPKNQKIDFLSLDVEGEEESVLRSNDWKKYRPQILLVEILDGLTFKNVANASITNYLNQNGYAIFAKTLTSCFYEDLNK